jgi:transcriptional regulator with XRE-family HTH domain
VKDVIARFVGKHVHARRAGKGWTQTDLADRVGISRQALSAIERGDGMPATETMYALAGALRCEVYDLLPTYKQVTTEGRA